MSAQDLKQRARELLAAEYRIRKPYRAGPVLRGNLTRYEEAAIRAIVAALRQQPAPVDLEQFRAAICSWREDAIKRGQNASDETDYYNMAERVAEADRLLSIIDNAGKVEVLARGWFHRLPDGDYDIHDEASGAGKDCDGCVPCLIVASTIAHQPAPVVDDARMARALEWFRHQHPVGEHVHSIEEAIAAYDPNCDARTVRVVDDAMRKDAERYRWLRKPTSDVGLVIDKVTGEVPYHEGTHTGGYATYEYRAGDELDSAIDAAIARAQEALS